MKVIIRSNKGLRIRAFYLPLFLLKTKWGMKLLKEITGINFLDKTELKQTLNLALKQLKAFIKANGHFNCVDVRSNDGEGVTIRL